MYGSAIIVFREVLEAALVLGIVLAAARGVASSRRWIGGGVIAGILGAMLVAAGAESISSAFEGVGQEILNAAILLTAVLMLAWHSIWMSRHGAQIAREMRAVGHDVSTGARPLYVLALVVGLAVLREGSEVVLFLYGIAAGGTEAGAMWTGAAAGLAAGAAVGALMYRGLLRIPSRHLFSVTGWMIVLLAAGMAGQAGAYLVQAGLLPGLVEPLWDSSLWLPQDSIIGEVLHVLVGYADRPSLMQVIFFTTTLAAIAGLDRLVNRPARKSASAPLASAASLLIAVAIAAHTPRADAAHVVYSPLVEEGEVAEFEKEPGGDMETTEIASENVFQLTEQGRYWADFGLLAEYAYSLEDGGHDKLELGFLAQKDMDRHEARLNLIFERELTGGADTEMEYAWQYRYRLGERFEPGIEMYGGLGDWGHMGSFNDHEQQIGPACFGKLRTNTGAWKYEAAMLFGLNDETPDATVRFMLEYEF